MSEENWRIAHDRALLYVRGSSLGSLEGLELVVEVLREARVRVERNPGTHPVSETMRLLRQRLSRGPGEGKKEVPGPFPLNRSGMVPGRMDGMARLFRPLRRKKR